MQPTKSLVMASLLTGFALVGSLLAPAQAGTTARGFVCGSTQGAPSTNAVKPDGGQVPVIRWTSNTFTSAGWSPQRRCEEVSKRFDTYFNQGRLRYITTGRMNSLPVICTATRHAGRCDGLLYTLKPGQNATATLLNLLEIRVMARGPLNETTGRLYVSLDELMNTAEANAAGESSTQTPASKSQGTVSLW